MLVAPQAGLDHGARRHGGKGASSGCSLVLEGETNMVRVSYMCHTVWGGGAGAVLGATLLSQAWQWGRAQGLPGTPWPAQEPQGAELVGVAGQPPPVRAAQGSALGIGGFC